MPRAIAHFAGGRRSQAIASASFSVKWVEGATYLGPRLWAATPVKVPQALKEIDLPGRIRAAGGASLKEAGEFFGWEPARVTKAAADFTNDELLARGWTRKRLLNVAEGYEHINRITPDNPSAVGRARQLRELAKLLG